MRVHSSILNGFRSHRVRVCVAGAIAGVVPATQAWAVDGTYVGGTGNYSDTTKWTGGTVATGSGATATVNLGTSGNTAITLDAAQTIGSLVLTGSTGQSFSLAGAGTTLTLDNGASTPTFLLNTYFGKGYQFGTGGLTLAGTNGLSVNTGSNTFALLNGLSWTGFSGTLTITNTAGGTGTIDPQAGSLLPSTSDLNLSVTGSNAVQLGLFSGRNQTIGALIGTAATYLENNSTSATNTILTIGNNNDSGTFAGTIGKAGTGTGSGTAFASNIGITKVGTGTETFTGTSYAGGTTTINAGTLLVDGTHTATITTTGNAAATTGTGGLYAVNSTGTLGGTGTIRPFDTVGGGFAMAVNAGGVVSPGDPTVNNGIGTLTLDNTASLKTVLGFDSTTASLAFDLGAGLTSDKIALIGNTTNAYAEVGFDSTVINFTDKTSGALAAGQYVLFSGDAATNYSGLTEDGSGDITAGLTIGTGLSAYSATLQQVGTNIVLNVATPEPASLGMLGLGAITLLRRSRRRAI